MCWLCCGLLSLGNAWAARSSKGSIVQPLHAFAACAEADATSHSLSPYYLHAHFRHACMPWRPVVCSIIPSDIPGYGCSVYSTSRHFLLRCLSNPLLGRSMYIHVLIVHCTVQFANALWNSNSGEAHYSRNLQVGYYVQQYYNSTGNLGEPGERTLARLTARSAIPSGAGPADNRSTLRVTDHRRLTLQLLCTEGCIIDTTPNDRIPRRNTPGWWRCSHSSVGRPLLPIFGGVSD